MKNLQYFANLLFKRPISIFVLIYIFLLILLPWRGFYLLNDSYVYEWNVRNFFENNFTLHPLTSPTMLFQTTVGSILYIVYDSPSILRLLTSLFFLLGTIGFYLILKKLTNNTGLIILVTLLLMFNPLYLNLGFTFMSDVYYLSLFIVSSYFLYIYLLKDKYAYLFYTAIFLTFLFLTRQTGLIVILSFILITYCYKKSFKVLLPFIIPLGVVILYQLFYPKPIAYTHQSIQLTINNLMSLDYFTTVIFRFIKTFYYIGYFIFPLTLSYLMTLFFKKQITKRYLLKLGGFFIFFALFSIYFWVEEKSLMFYIPNIITYSGFAPQNIGMGVKQTYFADISIRVKGLYTFVSALSVSIFLATYIDKINLIIKYKKLLIVVFIPSIFTLMASLVFRDYFDRYILVILPAFLLITFIIYKDVIDVAKYSFIFTFVFITTSFVFEHDYLSFNKFIWKTSNQNSNNGYLIKSTFEYNAYNSLDKIKDVSDPLILFNRELWLPREDSYIYYISYTGVAGFCDKEILYYHSLISPTFKGQVKILRPCN